MKKAAIPIAILAMFLLLGGAMAWDSVRYASNARYRVTLADDEMRKHEERVVKLLADEPKATPEVKSAIAAYQQVAGEDGRPDAYEQLIVGFRKTMSDKIDPTNPLDRKFMDDVAGAINRREIAEKQYDEEWAAYRTFLSGFRGRIAKVFLSSARADGSPTSNAAKPAH